MLEGSSHRYVSHDQESSHAYDHFHELARQLFWFDSTASTSCCTASSCCSHESLSRQQRLDVISWLAKADDGAHFLAHMNILFLGKEKGKIHYLSAIVSPIERSHRAEKNTLCYLLELIAQSFETPEEQPSILVAILNLFDNTKTPRINELARIVLFDVPREQMQLSDAQLAQAQQATIKMYC